MRYTTVAPYAAADKPGEDKSDGDDPPAEDSSASAGEELRSIAKVIDPAKTKQRLLELLATFINTDSQRGDVEKLILGLESLKVTPITDTFTELALAGRWVLLFSSTRTLPGGNIRLREMEQTLDPEKKALTNRALWSYDSRDGQYHVSADLFVSCSYKFVGPGRLEVTLKNHKVQVQTKDGKESKIPPDMQSVVVQLQRTLPIEFFDPSGLVDVSYIEPNFRVGRFVGKRAAGVRNVFTRVGEEENVAV